MRVESRHDRQMGSVRAWLQSWRSGIRLGETAIVIGLWAGALAVSDTVIAQLLFVFGLIVGLIAVFADSSTSRAKIVVSCGALVLAFAAAEAVYFYRKSPQPAEATREIIRREIVRYYPIPAQPSNPPKIIEAEPKPPVYQIIVKEVAAAAPAVTIKDSGLQNSDRIKAIRARMEKNSVDYAVKLKCKNEVYALSAPLYTLIGEAARYQNEFATYRISKQILGDLDKWIAQVHSYFADSKGKIPDTGSFDLANYNNPLGLIRNRAGVKAWEIMDLKRKALETLRDQIESKSCDPVKAMSDCEDRDSC